MTAHKTITLRCDAEGCGAHFDGRSDATTPAVHKAAKRVAGWSYIPGHPAAPQPAGCDFCLEHRAYGGAR